MTVQFCSRPLKASSLWTGHFDFIFRASKSTGENTITFGQESDYTGPLGNTMKVVAQRNGDVITATAMGVDIKLELVGGKGGFQILFRKIFDFPKISVGGVMCGRGK